MTKRVYELTRVNNFFGYDQTIVFHKQGDINSFDSLMNVENFKKGNPYETEQDFINHCKAKCKAYDIQLINNL